MRSIRLAAAVLSVLALAACDVTPPSAPVQPEAGPALSRAVVTPRQELEVSLTHTMFIACAEENVRFEGEMVLWLTRTSTPTGNTILHVTIPASAATVQATGTESGRVWTLQHGSSAQTIVTLAGETKVVNVSRHETYVSASGETLQLTASLRLHAKDDGTVIVQSEDWSCR